MDEIATNPYMLLEKMKNSRSCKFRSGVYRCIVSIMSDEGILLVVGVRHRSRAYRNLHNV